jgi:prepilin-type N-terminal cleavage/methylation domain-containing protein/prepilin-type processing-associated H-X9-DG protein
MTTHRPARGFTLIELLVVVAIIAGLIAILVPSLAHVRRKASLVACSVNLKSLSSMDNLYGNENNGFIPRNAGGNVPPSGLVPSIPYLFMRLQKMPIPTPGGTGPTLPGTPTTPGTATIGGFATSTPFESIYLPYYRQVKWLQCPAFPTPEIAYDYVTNGFDPANPAGDGNGGIPWIEMRRVHRANMLINFTEANLNFPTSPAENSTETNEIWHRDHLNENKSTTILPGSTAGRIATDRRHGGSINISYFDTHVEAKDWKKVTVRDFTNR